MPSRVLTGAKVDRAEAFQWTGAPGEPVNAGTASDPLNDAPLDGGSLELDAARRRIAALETRLQELETGLPRTVESARAEGRAEGERAGAASASAALQPLLDRLSNTIADLASFRSRFRRESEPELLRLSLAVARKILHRELTVDPHSLLGILKAAIASINQAELLSVRAHPDDAAALSARIGALELPDAVEILPDRTLERGSVILSTRRGQIDASIHTQLAEIENGFADRIAAHNAK